MFLQLLSRLDKVSVAATPAEKQACARFGYDVYVREMGYTPSGTDHAREVVWDAHDALPNAIHLYAGKVDDIRGVMRLLVWKPGAVDAAFARTYSMHLFPGLDRLHTAEVGRLMIRPSVRGKLILPSLARAAYEVLVADHQVDIAFAECRPGLVPHYRRMGWRPYAAPLTRTPEGFMVPVANVTSDIEYQRAMGAVTARLAVRYFGRGGRPRLDLAPFDPLFEEDRQRIELDSEQVWAAFEEEVARPHDGPRIFDGLSEDERKLITRGGLVLEVAAGADAAVAGRSERELYIVLDGELEVLAGGHVVAALGPGDVFGEMAFFRDEGARSATVRAATEGRLLALSRKFLDRLRKEAPAAAHTLLFNLGRILSERLAARNGAGAALVSPTPLPVRPAEPAQ